MNQNSGFNQISNIGFNNLNGNNNNTNTLTQQPNNAKFCDVYDYQWYDKPSQNGEFKYGLFQCCQSEYAIQAILPIAGCFCPCPLYIAVADLNGEVADVVGNMRDFD